MAQFNSKEYTRIRDIVQKRMKRAVSAGLMSPVHFPTMKEIKAGIVDPGQAMRALQGFYSGGSQVKAIRQTGLVPEFRQFPELPKQRKLTTEEQKQRRREQQRFYRQRKRIRQLGLTPEKQERYETYLKGLNTILTDWGPAGKKFMKNLGQMTPGRAQAFVEYIEYRFSQGDYTRKYIFQDFVDEFDRMLKSGYDPKDVSEDFNLFLENREDLKNRADNMEGLSKKEFEKYYHKFLKEKGIKGVWGRRKKR